MIFYLLIQTVRAMYDLGPVEQADFVFKVICGWVSLCEIIAGIFLFIGYLHHKLNKYK